MKKLLIIFLVLSCSIVMASSRGNIYSTKAGQCFSQMVDQYGNCDLSGLPGAFPSWITIDNATQTCTMPNLNVDTIYIMSGIHTACTTPPCSAINVTVPLCNHASYADPADAGQFGEIGNQTALNFGSYFAINPVLPDKITTNQTLNIYEWKTNHTSNGTPNTGSVFNYINLDNTIGTKLAAQTNLFFASSTNKWTYLWKTPNYSIDGSGNVQANSVRSPYLTGTSTVIAEEIKPYANKAILLRRYGTASNLLEMLNTTGTTPLCYIDSVCGSNLSISGTAAYSNYAYQLNYTGTNTNLDYHIPFIDSSGDGFHLAYVDTGSLKYNPSTDLLQTKYVYGTSAMETNLMSAYTADTAFAVRRNGAADHIADFQGTNSNVLLYIGSLGGLFSYRFGLTSGSLTISPSAYVSASDNIAANTSWWTYTPTLLTQTTGQTENIFAHTYTVPIMVAGSIFNQSKYNITMSNDTGTGYFNLFDINFSANDADSVQTVLRLENANFDYLWYIDGNNNLSATTIRVANITQVNGYTDLNGTTYLVNTATSLPVQIKDADGLRVGGATGTLNGYAELIDNTSPIITAGNLYNDFKIFPAISDDTGGQHNGAWIGFQGNDANSTNTSIWIDMTNADFGIHYSGIAAVGYACFDAAGNIYWKASACL